MTENKSTEEQILPAEENAEGAADKPTAEAALQERYCELETSYKRLAADLENYRKRSERQLKEVVTRANENLIVSLLPVLDNYELALSNADKDNSFAKGMEMIYCQLMNILTGEGLEPLEAAGETFDPNIHEAIDYVEGEGECDTVLDVSRRGYKLGGKLIRPCLVRVSKQKEEKVNG